MLRAGSSPHGRILAAKRALRIRKKIRAHRTRPAFREADGTTSAVSPSLNGIVDRIGGIAVSSPLASADKITG